MHKSVLLKESLEYLECENRHIVLDCTIGGAGHAKEILKRLPPGGRLIGIDADKKALAAAEESLENSGNSSFILANENFRNFDGVLRDLKIDSVDGMLFDLGISSFQLEDETRGFSFSKAGELDMRMDKANGEPLWKVLNALREDELGEIIRDLGEERYWRRIAGRIVSESKKSPIRDSARLAEIIRQAVPTGRQAVPTGRQAVPTGRQAARYRRGSRIDTATRTFQALRIFINDELGALKEALNKISSFLLKDGRVVIISFHSLEDRIVKHKFKELAKEGFLEILTKKPIVPGEAEIRENPRCRSAKLRAARRI